MRCDGAAWRFLNVQSVKFSRGLEKMSLRLDFGKYFDNDRNMEIKAGAASDQKISHYADMFSAMGAEARLRILRLLLAAHPGGMRSEEHTSELQSRLHLV